MSFFDEYLQTMNEKDDKKYPDDDRDAFVFALMQLRLANSLFFPPGEYAQVVPSLIPTVKNQSLIFVSSFLCYFIVKPPKYKEQMDRFKAHYIKPADDKGFANNPKLQAELSHSVKPLFSTVSLHNAKWNDINDYFSFDIEQEPSQKVMRASR